VSKWRVPRARMITIAVGTAMAIAAAFALPQVHAGDADCLLVQARLETSEYPALELHFCAVVPSSGGAAVVRYDVGVRVAIIPSRPR